MRLEFTKSVIVTRSKMEIKIKKAFTLVELLVVISIIALLLSIMMPALQKARKLGQGSVCLGNTRQMAIAFQCYSMENNGQIVSSRVRAGTGNSWVQFPQNESGAVTWSMANLVCPLEDRLRGIKRGLLYPYLKNVKVYHCPADPRIRSGTYGYRTYAMIGCLNGWFQGEKMASGLSGYDNQVIKIEQIKRPSTSYMLVESADSRGFNMTWWSLYVPEYGPDGVPPVWWSPLAILHGDSSTLAFSDGHSELHKWREKVTIDMAKKQLGANQNYGIWRVPDGQKRDIDYMYDGWAYKYRP